MKKIIIWLVIGLLLAVGYIASMDALHTQLETALSQAAKRSITLDSVQVTFPPGLRLNGLAVTPVGSETEIPLIAEAVEAKLATNLVSQGKAGVKISFVRPKIHTEWNQATREMISLLRPMEAQAEAENPPPIAFGGLEVIGGSIMLIDQMVAPNVAWDMRGVRLEANPSGGPNEYLFKGTGDLFKEGQRMGRLEIDGSAVIEGPVHATVKLYWGQIQHLSPYLKEILGTAPDSGEIVVESKMTIHQGVILAHQEVIATNVSFPTEEQTLLGSSGNQLVELLKDRDGKVRLSFNLTGRVGQKIDWSDLAASAMREAMQQAMARGIQKVLTQTERPMDEVFRQGMESTGR